MTCWSVARSNYALAFIHFVLQDLTKLETGKETSFNEPFDLHTVIEDAVSLYRSEAVRRGLEFNVDASNGPRMVIGDAKKIRTVVANLTANAGTVFDVAAYSVLTMNF